MCLHIIVICFVFVLYLPTRHTTQLAPQVWLTVAPRHEILQTMMFNLDFPLGRVPPKACQAVRLPLRGQMQAGSER